MLEVQIENILPVTEARDRFNQLVDGVENSDDMFVLTKNGKPAAIMVGVHHLEKLTGENHEELFGTGAKEEEKAEEETEEKEEKISEPEVAATTMPTGTSSIPDASEEMAQPDPMPEEAPVEPAPMATAITAEAPVTPVEENQFAEAPVTPAVPLMEEQVPPADAMASSDFNPFQTTPDPFASTNEPFSLPEDGATAAPEAMTPEAAGAEATAAVAEDASEMAQPAPAADSMASATPDPDVAPLADPSGTTPPTTSV